MLKLKTFSKRLMLSLPMMAISLVTHPYRVLADTTTSSTTNTTTAGGGALPSTNPFQVDWGSVMGGGGAVSYLLPLVNYGLGIYGAYLLFHGIRHLLHRSKSLMEGKTSYKEFIPVVAGFCMVLLVLSGAWYHILISLLVPINQAFNSTPTSASQ